MVIEVPSLAHCEEVVPSDLPKDWRSFRNYDSCQQIGDEWFDRAEFLCLKVPSAFVMENHNIVINTFHPKYSEVKLVDVLDFYPDGRLEELLKQTR
jgi:RES domain-containing protein